MSVFIFFCFAHLPCFAASLASVCGSFFLVQIRSRHRESLREASLTDRVDAAVFLCPLCSLTTIGHFCAPLGAVRGPPSDADAVGSGHHHRRRSRCHHPQPHLVLFFFRLCHFRVILFACLCVLHHESPRRISLNDISSSPQMHTHTHTHQHNTQERTPLAVAPTSSSSSSSSCHLCAVC